MNAILRLPMTLLSGAMILAVRGYQYLIRPILPPACIYEPGCSEYFIGAVRKYGPVIGSYRGCRRLCRCHPWGRGGYDPP